MITHYGADWRSMGGLEGPHFALVKDGVVISASDDHTMFGYYDGAELIAGPEPMRIGQLYDQGAGTVRNPAVKPADIKREAQRRILARYPLWRQINMMAQLSKLQNAQILSAEEMADEAAIAAAFDWIEAVRAASGQIELAPPASLEELKSDPRWPG